MGGTIFGRKRKKQADGQICPLCQLLNAEEAESCSRCYYEFTVAAHRQTVSEITEGESDDLFDALLQEEDEEEDANDGPLVDWTGHSFSMDDMTVEVSQYDDDGLVEVDQSVSMEHQFDSPQQVARVKGEEPEEEEEYVLTAADAPKNATKFDIGEGPDFAFEEEEYSAPVVKLIEMTESEDIEPVQSASAIPDEMANGATVAPSPQLTPVVEPQSIPAEPVPVTAIPEVPAIPTIPEVPAIPTIPEIPMIPELPQSNNAPDPSPTGIWPWPQSDAWDDTTVRKALRDAMESAKSGDIDASKRIMVGLGPHLGDRVDLVFHVGVLLKRFEQEEVMRRMIESAQRQYPDSPEVAKAAQHLLA
ncbi:MAG: hypothetical protein VYB17_03665 [Candidatus Thermoplasmatota archaeon]|nr:hypothetical protein [Candidatus Thermoplasmatota archaeon]